MLVYKSQVCQKNSSWKDINVILVERSEKSEEEADEEPEEEEEEEEKGVVKIKMRRCYAASSITICTF